MGKSLHGDFAHVFDQAGRPTLVISAHHYQALAPNPALPAQAR